MPIVNRVADLHAEITAWRRDLHAHPGTALRRAPHGRDAWPRSSRNSAATRW